MSAKCLIAGFAVAACLLVLGVEFASLDPRLDKLFQPAGWIMKYGPGGKEDPLLLLIAIPAQIATYTVLIYGIVSGISRIRREPEGRD